MKGSTTSIIAIVGIGIFFLALFFNDIFFNFYEENRLYEITFSLAFILCIVITIYLIIQKRKTDYEGDIAYKFFKKGKIWKSILMLFAIFLISGVIFTKAALILNALYSKETQITGRVKNVYVSTSSRGGNTFEITVEEELGHRYVFDCESEFVYFYDKNRDFDRQMRKGLLGIVFEWKK